MIKKGEEDAKKNIKENIVGKNEWLSTVESMCSIMP